MVAKSSPAVSSVAAWTDHLQSRGRYSFTRAEAASAAERSDIALENALRRLKRRGRIISPRRKFYVIVPVEYRAAGAPPVAWFIDDLMRFLAQPYYVGLLSAAAIHGAAHQQPMVLQIVTDRPTRPIRMGRLRIDFHMSRSFASAVTVRTQTDTGAMSVATAETTAFDLVRFAAASGYLSNVATVLSELSERIDPLALASVAEKQTVADVQRLGYLLEKIGSAQLADPLMAVLERRRCRAVVLAPWEKSGRKQAMHTVWRVIPNEDVDVDQ